MARRITLRRPARGLAPPPTASRPPPPVKRNGGGERLSSPPMRAARGRWIGALAPRRRGRRAQSASLGFNPAPTRYEAARRHQSVDLNNPGERRAMTELWRRSAIELAGLIARREASSAEVVEAHLGRIEAVNPRLNAVVRILANSARADAAEADRRVAAGAALGPLHGVPVTVKENIDMAGLPTTQAVRALADAVAPRGCAGGGARARRRGHPHRADQPAGLRLSGAHPVGPSRPDPQPLEPRAHHRRLQRRRGRGPGQRHESAGPGQ